MPSPPSPSPPENKSSSARSMDSRCASIPWRRQGQPWRKENGGTQRRQRMKRPGAPLIAHFAMSGCRAGAHTSAFPRRTFHHKPSVTAITDFQPATGDNDVRLGEGLSCARLSRRPPKPPKSHFGTLFDNPARQKSPLSRLFSKILILSPLESKI